MADNQHLCGHEHAKWLDNRFRRALQNPATMFREYIKPGSTVVDIGCGPGAFTLELAKLTGIGGRVFAIDVQDEMLAMARKKISSAGMLDRVQFHRCSSDTLGIDVRADFILTFYMVHETPAPLRLIDQIYALLNSGGIYFLAEPKVHATKRQFDEVLSHCESKGLSVIKRSGILSRIAVLRKPS
jgi:ubiquinone/menaquinone biosynthesis C-methylase UbiE